jgi:hypothetical protein
MASGPGRLIKVKLTKIVAGVGITGALVAGAMGVGTGVASAAPGFAPVPAYGPYGPPPPPPGWRGPADWYHPEWPGWNNGYPAAGWIPPQGWDAPPDWNNPVGWAPPPWWNPCVGPIHDILHPFRCL